MLPLFIIFCSLLNASSFKINGGASRQYHLSLNAQQNARRYAFYEDPKTLITSSTVVNPSIASSRSDTALYAQGKKYAFFKDPKKLASKTTTSTSTTSSTIVASPKTTTVSNLPNTPTEIKRKYTFFKDPKTLAPSSTTSSSSPVVVAAAPTTTQVNPEYALLFDCDGVIVETEELHRIAYNKAFAKYGLMLPGGIPVVWDLHYYDKLQNTVGGGKPKMKYYFTKDSSAFAGLKDIPEGGLWAYSTLPLPSPAPVTDDEKSDLIDKLQDAKTEFYVEAVEKLATARPGVIELMDAAIKDPQLKVGICSAATKAGFVTLVNSAVGKVRLDSLDVVLAGDDVKNKKPDPEIYNTAKNMINMDASKCIVIEDSIVGLKAAKSAGMRCIITYTSSTEKEDFKGHGADEVVADLSQMTLEKIKNYFKVAPNTQSKSSPVKVTTPSTPIPATVGAVAKVGWNLSVLLAKR